MHVLIVDDDTSLRDSLVRLAHKLGHTTAVAENAWDAFDHIEKTDFDAIITDVQMPDGNGIELLQILTRLQYTAPVYVHSSEAKFYFQREHIDLATHIPAVFGAHTSFTLKDAHIETNIAEFLTGIDTP